MNAKEEISGLKARLHTAFPIEWRLLAFLILFMNVKLAVKAIAIILAYFFQPDFKFGFSYRNSRLPLFYLIVILIALLNFTFFPILSVSYLSVAFTGILIWTACVLGVHQVKLSAERTDIMILHNTLLVFFILNILVSLLNLSFILVEIGVKNPFLYQGQHQKYFMNTGDYIKGLSGDTSTTNSLVSCFGIVYFLYQKKYVLTMISMIVLLITASNFSNVILLSVFACIFVFNSIQEQKTVIVICMMMMILFFAKISPQNNSYVGETLKNFVFHPHKRKAVPDKIIPIRDRPDSLLTAGTRKEKIATLFMDRFETARLKKYSLTDRIKQSEHLTRPELPKDSIHTAAFQWSRDTTNFQRRLLSYVKTHLVTDEQYAENSPGKVQALKQSVDFLQSHREKMLTGTGMGNFSSKLAFRATGLKMAGSFPESLVYCNPDFLKNHLSLYAFFFSKQADSHSIIHNPASVYDQMLTEYGIIGLLALGIYYIGFFVHNLKSSSYGLPLLFILVCFFMVDYWFEQLSVIVIFECMMFIDMKEYKNKTAHV